MKNFRLAQLSVRRSENPPQTSKVESYVAKLFILDVCGDLK